MITLSVKIPVETVSNCPSLLGPPGWNQLRQQHQMQHQQRWQIIMVRAHPLPRQPRQQHTFNSTRLLLSMLLTIDSHKCLGAVVNNAPTLHGW